LAALTKYLLTLSKSLAPRPAGSITETTKPREEDEGLGRTREGNLEQPPDAAFKRLHILHIVHDVLSYVALKSKDSHHINRIRCDDAAWESLKTHASLLAQLAACSENKTRQGSATLERLRRIVHVWQKLNIFDATACSSIISKCEKAGTMSWNDLQQKFEAEEAQVLLGYYQCNIIYHTTPQLLGTISQLPMHCSRKERKDILCKPLACHAEATVWATADSKLMML
jgi:hypothetical protein